MVGVGVDGLLVHLLGLVRVAADGVQEDGVVAEVVGVVGVGVDGLLVHLLGLVHVAADGFQEDGVGTEDGGVDLGGGVDGALKHGVR